MRKYNAKTETQQKFAERIEKELGYVCDFDYYYITRGRGWAKQLGSCSASVKILPTAENPYGGYLGLFHPLRNYLSKKKYLSFYWERGDCFVELEDSPEKTGKLRLK